MDFDNDDDSYMISREDVKSIRYALIVGMQAVGEIERLRTMAGGKEALGMPWPKEAVPRHPTGDHVTGSFADALASLGY